jgi:hypothetical protein
MGAGGLVGRSLLSVPYRSVNQLVNHMASGAREYLGEKRST